MLTRPEKEVRFTRSAQARSFAIMGAIVMGVGVTFLASYYEASPWLGYLVAAVLLGVASGFFWLSFHCARHAFLIFSPVGVELFPFFKPSKNYQLWNWADFASAEIKDKLLYLHFDKEKTGGAVISLSPMQREARELLVKVIEGRMKERESSSEDQKNDERKDSP